MPGIPHLNFPTICPEEPQGNSAFCSSHLVVAEKRGYKTDVKGFLKQVESHDQCEQKGSEMMLKVAKSQGKLCVRLKCTMSYCCLLCIWHRSLMKWRVAYYHHLCYTGTHHFIEEHVKILKECDVPKNVYTCHKDIGEKSKLQCRSRGHLFIVRTCGHIETWRPLYRYMCSYRTWFSSLVITLTRIVRSESPSQVFMITLVWLYDVLKDIPPLMWLFPMTTCATWMVWRLQSNHFLYRLLIATCGQQ